VLETGQRVLKIQHSLAITSSLLYKRSLAQYGRAVSERTKRLYVNSQQVCVTHNTFRQALQFVVILSAAKGRRRAGRVMIISGRFTPACVP
jgi:hypothetical protein